MSEPLTVEAAAVAYCAARHAAEPLRDALADAIKGGPGYVDRAEVCARAEYEEAIYAAAVAWEDYLQARRRAAR